MTKIDIATNDNQTITVAVDEYNPDEIAELLNDRELNMVVIGDAVIQRYSVVRITPHKEEEDE